jgi:hypothetical protein
MGEINYCFVTNDVRTNPFCFSQAIEGCQHMQNCSGKYRSCFHFDNIILIPAASIPDFVGNDSLKTGGVRKDKRPKGRELIANGDDNNRYRHGYR